MALPAAAPAAVSGLPQFDVSQWPGEIVWTLLVFGLLYLLFARVFVPRVGGAIADREDRISGEIGQATRMRDDARGQAEAAAGDMALARARARKVAEEATAAVKQEAQAQRAREDARIAEVLTAADADIAAARREAMTHVRVIASGVAAAMVEKLTGTAPATDEVEAAGAQQAGRA